MTQTPKPSYRIALRPYESNGGAGEHPSAWDHDGGGVVSPPLDDIVVNDVSMFRMEDMGDHFWMCCYLEGTDERISFTVRKGRPSKGEPHLVVEAYEFPDADVAYETRETKSDIDENWLAEALAAGQITAEQYEAWTRDRG
jgi:hypothetical protein